ncbi:MAG: hypothetical protein CMM47_00965 [Rhodospirillaceae bacterium]|nr:hypothetical protein [Rhodospirillaceae bacterium]
MTNKEFAQWMLKVRAWRKSVDNLFQKGDDAAIERKNQWIEDLASVPFDVACQFLVDVRRGLTPGPENWETSELPRFVRSYSNRMENKKIQAAQHNRFRAEQSQAFSAVMADKSMRAAMDHLVERMREHKEKNKLKYTPGVDEVPGLRKELEAMI